MNFVAVARFAALLRYDAVANMPSSSIPVPTFWNGITFRSESLKSLPVAGFFDSSTWASSLYVIAEAESAWCLTKKSMLNGSWTMVTSFELFGSMPFFVRAANSSHWFPPSQLADLLVLHRRDRLDPRGLPRDLRHPGAGEDLRDVDEPCALVARREQAGQPVDSELCAARRRRPARG